MAKTPSYIVALIRNQQDMMIHISSTLSLRINHPHNAAAWIMDHPAEYFVGQAEGTNQCLEAAMRNANCYAGFSYIYFENGEMKRVATEEVQDGTGHYTSWCRQYHIR